MHYLLSHKLLDMKIIRTKGVVLIIGPLLCSALCGVRPEASVAAAGYDGIVLVTDCLEKLQGDLSPLQATLKEQASFGELY